MPPTRAEIALRLGFKSANAAEEHLKALAKKGLIVLEPGSARGIRLVEQLGLPLFVKPANQGSSVGVSKVNSEEQYQQAVALAFEFDHKVVVEQGIKGREIECAVLGNDHPQASTCGEIVLNSEFYAYDTKYIDDQGAQEVLVGITEPIDRTFVIDMDHVARINYSYNGIEGSIPADVEADETTRYTTTLDHQALLTLAADSITEEGFFCVVLPEQIGNAFSQQALGMGWHLRLRTDVAETEARLPHRVLLAFSPQAGECFSDRLVIRGPDQRYSEGYTALTQAFYLFM